MLSFSIGSRVLNLSSLLVVITIFICKPFFGTLKLFPQEFFFSFTLSKTFLHRTEQQIEIVKKIQLLFKIIGTPRVKTSHRIALKFISFFQLVAQNISAFLVNKHIIYKLIVTVLKLVFLHMSMMALEDTRHLWGADTYQNYSFIQRINMY